MRRVLAIILITLMVIPAVSAGTIDGSAKFLSGASKNSDRVAQISLSLMALVSARKDVSWNVSADINYLVNELLADQNPDGGWGYYLNEPSNVLDTAYAVLALQRAYPVVDIFESMKVRASIDRGVSYLLSAKGKNGWGYVPGSPVSCYPTVMALWALGEYGYRYNSATLRDAFAYIDNVTTCEISPYEFLALKVLAYHSAGYNFGEKTVNELKRLLLDNGSNLTVKERAMLTYALVAIAPMDLDVAKALRVLENSSKTDNDLVYWMNEPKFMSSTEMISSTAFALMALSKPVKVVAPKPVKNPYEMPCDSLVRMQNYGGGWGLRMGQPSNEKATYYALLALEKCNPLNETVEKALGWVEKAYLHDAESLENGGGMSVDYFYALETLLHFGLLNETQREKAVQLIKNSQLEYGLWGLQGLGPQPYYTALAIKALRDLGVPANDSLIVKAKDWLLSISNGGWGTYVSTPQFSYMLKPDVLTTITVLEALDGISTPEELEPHIKWLVEQRVGEGWSFWREYYVWEKNESYPGTPSVELTVRATDLLLKYGYNYTNQTLEFVMNARDSGLIRGKPIETAFTILYLSRFQYVPPVSLYDIRNALNGELFEVIAPTMGGSTLEEIIGALNSTFTGGFVRANSTGIGEGYYIVIAPYGAYDVRKYNPYLRFYIGNGSVTVGNTTVPMNESVVLVPGKTANGVVLFVFYSRNTEDIAREVFTTGFIRYIGGNAMILTREDGTVRLITVG